MAGVEDGISCGVCCEDYEEGGARDPVMLYRCGHTFCRPCLLSLEENKRVETTFFRCPTCRKPHYNPRVADLPVNYALLSVSRKRPRKCPDTCDTHGDPLRLWCRECCSVICAMCAFEQHKDGDHTVVGVQVAAAEKKDEIVDLTEQVALRVNQEREKLTRRLNRIAHDLAKLFEQSKIFKNYQQQTEQVKRIASRSQQILELTEALNTIQKLHKETCGEVDDVGEEEDDEMKDMSLLTMGTEEMVDATLEIITLDTKTKQENQEEPEPQEPVEHHHTLETQDPVREEPQPTVVAPSTLIHHTVTTDTEITMSASISGEQCYTTSPSMWPLMSSVPGCKLGWPMINWHNFLNQLPASQLLFPPERPIVYLNLSVKETLLGRVEIRLWGHMRRAQHFLALCLGTFGPSYKGSRFNSLQKNMKNDEFLIGGHGTSGQGLMEGLEWGGKHIKPAREGMITGCSNQKPELHAFFALCSSSNYTSNISGPFGEVIGGMSVVKKASRCQPVTSVIITDCGLVVPPTE